MHNSIDAERAAGTAGHGARHHGSQANGKGTSITQFSVEHALDAIFWFNRQAHVIYVNEAACRSLGYSPEELLSLSMPDFDPIFPKEAWESFPAGTQSAGLGEL